MVIALPEMLWRRAGHNDPRRSASVSDDADRLGNGHRGVVRCVDRYDLAGGRGLRDRIGESPARCSGCGAPAGVGSLSRDISVVHGCLGGPVARQSENNATATNCENVILIIVDALFLFRAARFVPFYQNVEILGWVFH